MAAGKGQPEAEACPGGILRFAQHGRQIVPVRLRSQPLYAPELSRRCASRMFIIRQRNIIVNDQLFQRYSPCGAPSLRRDEVQTIASVVLDVSRQPASPVTAWIAVSTASQRSARQQIAADGGGQHPLPTKPAGRSAQPPPEITASGARKRRNSGLFPEATVGGEPLNT